MPQFDYDVFISYSHIDNTPLVEDQKGWIAMLHDALRTRLAQLLGENPRIWRDKKLGGNDRFDQEIMDHIIRAATLVSVLSPRYVVSDWCKRELETFVDVAEHNYGVDVVNKSRIFKVVKTPIERKKEPDVARGLLGYPFYNQDPETGRWREFNRAFGQNLEPEFWRVLDDLAQDITKLLEMLRSGTQAVSSGATIYLAETTSDLAEDRDQIRRELEVRGHLILPDRPLPLTDGDLEDVINGYLERADLSIHPIGASYGLVPEARDQSILEIQNTLATIYSQAGSLSRLVWIPPGIETHDTRQAAFVNALNNDPNLSPHDAVLETTVEELKNVVADKLSPISEPGLEPGVGTDGLKRLYLIFDQRDEGAVVSLDDFLYERGFEVKEPLFTGDEAQVRQDHEDKLCIADAVIIYYGAADEVWLSKIIMDLARIPSPARVSAIYIGGPETKTKVRYRTREVDAVIKAFDGFKPESLDPFLARLEPGVTDSD